MSPESVSTIQKLVNKYLDFSNTELAIRLSLLIFSEGLFTFQPEIAIENYFPARTEENLLLLGRCYFTAQKYFQAYDILRDGKSSETIYYFSLTCFKLEKFQESEEKLDLLVNFQNPTASSFILSLCYELRGDIKKLEGRTNDAIEDYSEALKLNSFQFTSALKLSQLGCTNVSDFYNYFVCSSSTIEGSSQNNANSLVTIPHLWTFTIFKDIFGSLNNEKSISGSNKRFKINKNKKEDNNENSHYFLLKNNCSEVFLSNIKNVTPNLYLKEIFQLLYFFVKGHVHNSNFQSKEAISAFDSLPINQFNTGWVLCQVAKAYMEMGLYEKAEKYFQQVRWKFPYQIEGMELYSTVLWQLKKNKELCSLAQDLISINKLSPEAWCVVGNYFSSQKDHETAQKFFERAIQVEPRFYYAHTLLGHEYVYNEDFSKACVCFQRALRLDPRQYNSWYGLGMAYFRQEKYIEAESHFQKAIDLNREHSVLFCYLGMVYQELFKLALLQNITENLNEIIQKANLSFSKSLTLNPKNPLALYKKAEFMFDAGNYQEALRILDLLVQEVPKESSIYILKGKIYKKLNQIDKAILYFTWARDLDPKANSQLKEMIDNYMKADGDESHEKILSDN